MQNFSALVVGLGNPDSEYGGTRHNIGFMAVDALAQRYDAGAWKKKFKGLVSSSSDGRLLFLKPQTYMNFSGEFVVEAARFYKLDAPRVIVFHDDLDLQPGQVKVKQGGGHAGHNGLKSLDAHIGPDYWRVRLGIGHPGVRGAAVTRHVLNRFSKSDHVWLEPLLDVVAREFSLMLEGRATDYAQRVTRRMAEICANGKEAPA